MPGNGRSSKCPWEKNRRDRAVYSLCRKNYYPLPSLCFIIVVAFHKRSSSNRPRNYFLTPRALFDSPQNRVKRNGEREEKERKETFIHAKRKLTRVTQFIAISFAIFSTRFRVTMDSLTSSIVERGQRVFLAIEIGKIASSTSVHFPMA